MLRIVLVTVLLWFCAPLNANGQSDLANFFARLPAIESPALSPDGQAIAYIAHRGDDQAAVIIDLATGERTGVDISNVRAVGLFWASDETLMVRASITRSEARVRGDVDYFVLLAVDRATQETRQILQRGTGIGFNPDLSNVIGIEPETGRLLMDVRDDERNLNLIALDPVTDRYDRVARGNEETRYWVVDATGTRFARVDFLTASNRLVIRVREDDRWRTVLDDDQELLELRVLGFSQDGAALLIGHNVGRRQLLVIQRLEIATGELGDVVFADGRNDVSAYIDDPWTETMIGVRVGGDTPRYTWFDPALTNLQSALERAVPETQIRLVSWARDRSRFIVETEKVDQAPAYLLFTAANGQLARLSSAYPELEAIPLPRRQSVRYESRDGIEIQAYMTLPMGEGPHPFVVLPHGGPEAADTAGFDAFAHFLGRLGYGVIQPNFRGSSGRGKVWAAQGYGEWGVGVMQNDVTDATRWVVDQGYAEPDRICIAGGSYGAYAALSGVAFTPGLYACAIGFNGVYDLQDQHRYISRRFGRESQVARYWAQQITGDFNASDARIGSEASDRSPNRFAARIDVPVLLLHSQDDTIVESAQSRGMRGALERNGVNVRFVEMPGGDHYLSEYQTRLTVFAEMQAFLADNIGTAASD